MLSITLIIVSVNKCTDIQEEPASDVEPDPVAEPLIISSWGYQLQGADPDEVGVSGFDLVVFDYSRTGEEDGVYSAEELTGIKGDDVIPVAYISIGEAEEYRFYWENNWKRDPPEWLGKENSEWEGNYKVKYWLDSWKTIIYGNSEAYLDKLLEAGFDGAYLDIIDGYEYFEDLI